MTVTCAPATPPSVHIRAALTWAAIFPMVTLGMLAMAPFTAGWPAVLRALVLTAFVVPCAVYVAVPKLLAAHQFLMRHRSGRLVCGPQVVAGAMSAPVSSR